jgi:uncharacterized protein YcbX
VIRIDCLYAAPVKSLALVELNQALLDKPGIPGDRAFFIVDEQGELVTQREVASLVQVLPTYEVSSGELALAFPDGRSVCGVPELGDAASAKFFVQTVGGRLVVGGWNEALSAFAGRPLRLVKVEKPGSSFDAYPLSMCSLASVEALAKAAGRDGVDGRRFRQNLYLSGASPHEEDSWIGREVRVGGALLRVKMADQRCVVTTHSPETGETDLNTLRIITSYRTDQPKEANFGVYCTVVEPAEVRIGDAVVPQ